MGSGEWSYQELIESMRLVYLVGGLNPFETYFVQPISKTIVKMVSSSPNGENDKYLSCHHLVFLHVVDFDGEEFSRYTNLLDPLGYIRYRVCIAYV